MSVKDFLNQAQHLECKINEKIEQIRSLRVLACKMTATFNDSFVSKTGNKQKLEPIVAKIVDLQKELKNDLDEYVSARREISFLIKSTINPDYQLVLELRYLCSKSWEEIANEMHYSVQHIFRLHYKALNTLKKLVK